MKRLFVVLTITLFMFACGNSNEKNVKTVGVIDFEYVIIESKAGKQAQAEATAFEQTIFNEILVPKRQALLETQEEYNKLVKDKAATEASKTAKLEEFQNAKNEYDTYAQAVSERIQSNNTELSEKLVAEINEIVSEIAKEKNINFLSNIDSVIFTDGIPDITEDVLVRYNKQFDGK